MERQLTYSDTEWETLALAPFWVYRHVAAADLPPEPSQYRAFGDELAHALALARTPLARTIWQRAIDDGERLWVEVHLDRRSPEQGLTSVARLLERAPADDAAAVAHELVSLAVRTAAANIVVGEEPLSGPERSAVEQVAAWLGGTGREDPERRS